MKETITFILPTRNRIQWLIRAIESCLACESPEFEPHVLVIDGESEDNTPQILRDRYGGQHRVKVIGNSRTDGFMKTCFLGVEKTRSRYVTFMYDDDVLSPYFKTAIACMLGFKRSFFMGYGAGYIVHELYPFCPISEWVDRNPLDVMLAYCGVWDHLKYNALPVSPICCVVTIELLHRWVKRVQEFVEDDEMRAYFLMQKNIGPDLIIYFSAMLEAYDAARNVLLVERVIAQFSEHSQSMSLRFGTQELTIGYWLARVWLFNQLLERGERNAAAKCAGYLVCVALNIALREFRRGEKRWMRPLLKEVTSLVRQVIQGAMASSFLRAIMSFGLHKLVNKTKTSAPQ